MDILFDLLPDGTMRFYTIESTSKKRYGELLSCDVCGKLFVKGHNKLLRSKNNYCSEHCRLSTKTKTTVVYCYTCNKTLERTPKQIGQSKHQVFFCGKDCQSAAARIFESKPGYFGRTGAPYSKNSSKPKECLNCRAPVSSIRKYCSVKCQVAFQRNKNIQDWKEGKLLGYHDARLYPVKRWLRNWLFEQADNKCTECGYDKRNPFTGLLVLEIHHIDGNPKNCIEENLRVLCRNCHGLTENFCSRNRESIRARPAYKK